MAAISENGLDNCVLSNDCLSSLTLTQLNFHIVAGVVGKNSAGT